MGSIEGFVQRRLTREYAEMVSVMTLLICTVMLVVMFYTEDRGRTRFGPGLGGDYPGPYVAGWIYNRVDAARAYDRQFHKQTYHEIFPNIPRGQELPFVGAPFLILPFALLARLPYAWSFAAWIAIAIGLYITGFTLLWRTLEGVPRERYRTALLLALSFVPCVVESIAGGQTSAFGFFALATAISLERRGRALLGGVVLALCWYKLMFLALIAPMLLVTRSIRTFIGFLIGTATLGIVSILAVGWQGCLNYIDLLRYLSAQSSSPQTGLRKWKYVDINSFARLIFGENLALRWALVGAAVAVVLPLLLRWWWKNREGASATDRTLVWASAVAWTPVLNVYWGIYDAAIVSIAVLLTAEVLYHRNREAGGEAGALPNDFKYLMLAIYLLPWISQSIAQKLGLQVLTLALVGLGVYQLRMGRENAEDTEITEITERRPGRFFS